MINYVKAFLSGMKISSHKYEKTISWSQLVVLCRVIKRKSLPFGFEYQENLQLYLIQRQPRMTYYNILLLIQQDISQDTKTDCGKLNVPWMLLIKCVKNFSNDFGEAVVVAHQSGNGYKITDK